MWRVGLLLMLLVQMTLLQADQLRTSLYIADSGQPCVSQAKAPEQSRKGTNDGEDHHAKFADHADRS